MCVDENQQDTSIPIIFPEWSLMLGTKLKRQTFRLDVMLKAGEKPKNVKQQSMFDRQDEINQYLSQKSRYGRIYGGADMRISADKLQEDMGKWLIVFFEKNL